MTILTAALLIAAILNPTHKKQHPRIIAYLFKMSRKEVYAMAGPQKKFFTTEDIYALPEGIRAELINGQIYYMAPPSRRHQALVGELHATIRDYIRKKQGPCKVYPAPFAVFLNEDDLTYVEPDISVICDPNKLNDKGCSGAPDWIIEIVSPGSRQMDYYVKLFKYRSAEVRLYWIVDPEKEKITVWNFEGDDVIEFSFRDNVPVSLYEDFTIDFSGLDI